MNYAILSFFERNEDYLEAAAASFGLAMMAFVAMLYFISGMPSEARTSSAKTPTAKASPSKTATLIASPSKTLLGTKSQKLPVVTEVEREALRQNMEIARKNSELLEHKAAANIYLPVPRPALDEDLVNKAVSETRAAIDMAMQIVSNNRVSPTSDKANKASWKELRYLIEQGSYKLEVIELSIESVTVPASQQEYQDAAMEAFAWDAAQLKELQEKERKLLDSIKI